MEGAESGLVIGARLAARTNARIRWAARWVDDMELLASPSLDDARALVARAAAEDANQPVCVHWSPRLYTADDGPDAPWISFVGADGARRDDARVYAIELAGHAIPLTTLGDRPWSGDLALGPTPGTGWALRLVAIRDHMPESELVEWLAAAMEISRSSISVAR